MRWIRDWLKWITMTCVAVLVSGCSATVIDTSCDWTFYIRPEAADVDAVSDSLARQIVTHNERRRVVCK